VVFKDSPVEEAVRGAAFSAFIGSGQTCIAGRRFIVDESLYNEFVERLVGIAGGLRVGDARDPKTQMGPMISAVARNRVLQKVHLAAAEGVDVRSGGDEVSVDGRPGGFFMSPTVCTAHRRSTGWPEKRFSVQWPSLFHFGMRQMHSPRRMIPYMDLVQQSGPEMLLERIVSHQDCIVE